MESFAKAGGGGGMRVLCLIIVTAILGMASASGQSIRSLVNGGNNLYDSQKFADAEVNYRKALEKEQGLVQGHFNLGNSLYKQGKSEESIKEFEQAAVKAEDKDTKAYAYYNMGNAHMQGQRYQEAVQSYAQSLKMNPSDQDAKYNLSYALEKLKQQQQEQKKNDKQDKNKDQQDKKDQNQEKQNNKDQQKDKQRQQDQQQQQEQEQQGKQPQPQQEKRMSKADAQRILDVLKNNEKDVQKKLRVRQAVRSKTDRDW